MTNTTTQRSDLSIAGQNCPRSNSDNATRSLQPNTVEFKEQESAQNQRKFPDCRHTLHTPKVLPSHVGSLLTQISGWTSDDDGFRATDDPQLQTHWKDAVQAQAPLAQRSKGHWSVHLQVTRQCLPWTTAPCKIRASKISARRDYVFEQLNNQERIRDVHQVPTTEHDCESDRWTGPFACTWPKDQLCVASLFRLSRISLFLSNRVRRVSHSLLEPLERLTNVRTDHIVLWRQHVALCPVQHLFFCSHVGPLKKNSNSVTDPVVDVCASEEMYSKMIARHCWETVVVNVLLMLPSRPRDLAPVVSILVMTMREMHPDRAPGCRR